jgi:hypothetical protein
VVRVGARALRQKLAEYYAGPGKFDDVRLDIPKGGYRLTVAPQNTPTAPSVEAVAPSSPMAAVTAPLRLKGPGRLSLALLVLLAGSLLENAHQWSRSTANAVDPALTRVRASPMWADMIASNRPLTIVLGDLFMFTQFDAATGRTLTVRDPEINSSEEMQQYQASNPQFSFGRGQHYMSMIQKSAALGAIAIQRVVERPSRNIEVIVSDELQPDTVRTHDIIYVGSMSSLGPLVGYYQLRSRYRYDPIASSLTDSASRKSFVPEGKLDRQRIDYALATKFVGPGGNLIMMFTSSARNAGMQQVVRTLTSPAGLEKFATEWHAKSSALPESFEALLAVTGFKQTDLAATIVAVDPLPPVQLLPQTSAPNSALKQ